MPDLKRADLETGHDYTSTACFHGEHGLCRRLCKYCTADCGCQCHDEPSEPTAAVREYRIKRGVLARPIGDDEKIPVWLGNRAGYAQPGDYLVIGENSVIAKGRFERTFEPVEEPPTA